MAAEFFLQKGSPTYLQPENAADVMSITQFMAAQNLRQPQIPLQQKHTFEISEGESVEIEKIVAAERKDGQLYYKVKWVKYTWEAEESVQHLPHLIDGYLREHFYQHIKHPAIDTNGINIVGGTETDFTERSKSVVVNATERDVQTAGAQIIGDKIVITSENRGMANTAAVVGENNEVIMEFTMPAPPKPIENYQQQTASQQTGEAKKQRRNYPLERKYICNVCNKAFDRNTSLTRHLLTHTREKPFKCQICEKAFSQNAHLKRHILIHIGQKSYQCNKCGKMFIEKGGLARHEATHSTEKPWVCNQCGKAFVLNEYLQRHLFLHTGQKPYQCNECGRLFADGSSWRAHKLTHNKEKKFKCPVCSKMLKCKRNFKKHVAAHEEDKQMKHQCNVCDDRFSNKRFLKDHMKKNRKHHRCKVCRKPFTSRDMLMTHRATHDPNSATYNPDPVKLDPSEYESEEEEDDDETKSDDSMEPLKSHEEEMQSILDESDINKPVTFTSLIIKPSEQNKSQPAEEEPTMNSTSLPAVVEPATVTATPIRLVSSAANELSQPLPNVSLVLTPEALSNHHVVLSPSQIQNITQISTNLSAVQLPSHHLVEITNVSSSEIVVTSNPPSFEQLPPAVEQPPGIVEEPKEGDPQQVLLTRQDGQILP